MVRMERQIRGIPLWLMQAYLQELGGEPQPDGNLLGPGWSARLTQLEDFQVGSLRVGEVRLEIEAEPGSAGPLQEALEKKLMRAGG